MRVLAFVLAGLLLLTQYQLWFGEGGVLEVRRLKAAVETQQAENARLTQRNDALEADVEDLKSGLEGIEERARRELGMIKNDEVFYQVVDDE